MQIGYTSRPRVARAGMLGNMFSPRDVAARACNGLVQAGRGVFRVPVTGNPSSNPLDVGEVYQVPYAGDAADVDAILATGGASAATEQVWEGTELNGVVGDDELAQPRKVTLVLSSHADWNATNATLRYINHQGNLVQETLAIPDAGNATVTSVGYARQVISLTIPAQGGTGGTFTIGIAALDGSVTLADFEGVAHYEPIKEPASPGVAEYGSGDMLDVIVMGAVWCIVETAMALTDTVYCRGNTSGSGMGAFRNDNASGAAFAVTGAKVLDYDATTGLALIRFRGD